MSVPHEIPKTAMWIQDPWKLEADGPQQTSVDPYFFRMFPTDDAQAANGDEYFQHPVVINDSTNTVFDLSDIVRDFNVNHRGNEAFTNPSTRATYRLRDLNPVRFPGFKGYNNTVAMLQGLAMDNPEEQWTRLPVPDPEGAPTVEDGMAMPYSRPPPPSSSAPSPAPVPVRRGRRTVAMRMAEGLPIMRRVIVNFERRDKNTAESLQTLCLRFREEARRQGNAAMESENENFVRNLLVHMAKNEQGIGQRNVEVIYPGRGRAEMIYLLDAVPLMRLAHSFVDGFVRRNEGRHNVGTQMVVGLYGREPAVRFEDFIQQQHAFHPCFSIDLLYTALSQVPGVRIQTNDEGYKIMIITLGEVPPFNADSGFNKGHLLRDAPRVGSARSAPADSSGAAESRRQRPRVHENLIESDSRYPELIRNALHRFVHSFYEVTTFRNVAELRQRFAEFCSEIDIQIPMQGDFFALVIRNIRGIEAFGGGQYRVGPIQHEFAEDYADLLWRYFRTERARSMFRSFDEALESFRQFCLAETGRNESFERYTREVLLYELVGRRRAFLPVEGAPRGLEGFHSFREEKADALREFIEEEYGRREYPSIEGLMDNFYRFCLNQYIEWHPHLYHMDDVRDVLQSTPEVRVVPDPRNGSERYIVERHISDIASDIEEDASRYRAIFGQLIRRFVRDAERLETRFSDFETLLQSFSRYCDQEDSRYHDPEHYNPHSVRRVWEQTAGVGFARDGHVIVERVRGSR